MFDIKSYVILLNEVFVTGNSDESLTLHILPPAEQYTRNVRFHESYEW